MELTRATFKQKEVDAIPEGANVLSKDVSLEVEEIENGFLILKRIEAKYQIKDRTDYFYTTKKWFANENPLEIDMEAIEEKTLADNFE